MIHISHDKTTNLTASLAKSFGDIGYNIGNNQKRQPNYKELKSERLVQNGPVMSRSEMRKKRIEEEQATL